MPRPIAIARRELAGNSAPRLPAPNAYMTTTGRTRLTPSARTFLNCTLKSAPSSEVSIKPIPGAVVVRCRAIGKSVTQLAPRQADEYIFERDLSPGDLFHLRVVAVFGYQARRSVEADDLPVVDDRDAIADGLGFLHRMRGEQNAAASLPHVLDSL